MSVLSDVSIALKASSKELFAEDYDSKQLQGASYDLRIGTIFKNEEIISVNRNNDKIIKIRPSEIVTMLTLEKVKLPNELCATVFPINKMSSKGLLILNSGHIDPGYTGYITVCAINLSTETICISLKESIFTIIFYELDKATTKPFKNHLEYDNRIDIENFMYKNRASKLSPSIFDLITLKEYQPYLKEQIRQVLSERLSSRLFYWASMATIIAVLIASLTFLYQYYHDKSKDKRDSIRTSITSCIHLDN